MGPNRGRALSHLLLALGCPSYIRIESYPPNKIGFESSYALHRSYYCIETCPLHLRYRLLGRFSFLSSLFLCFLIKKSRFSLFSCFLLFSFLFFFVFLLLFSGGSCEEQLMCFFVGCFFKKGSQIGMNRPRVDFLRCRLNRPYFVKVITTSQ